MPERQLPGLPEGGEHVHTVVGDLDDAPARGAEGEDVVHPRLVDHLFVEFTDAGVLRLARDEDAEQAAIGDRAAARDGDPLRAGASGERARVSVPHEPRTQLGELVRRVAAGEKVERRLVRRPRERAERRAALDRLEPLLDVDRPEGAGGDRLLSQDVERVLGNRDRLDLARQHPFGDHGGVQDVAAVLGEKSGAADLADLMPGPADALETGCGARRCLDLDDEVDRTHVDTELEAARGDDAAECARLQLVFDLGALLLRHGAVVGLREDRGDPGGRSGLSHRGRRNRRLGHVDALPFGVDLVEATGQPLGEAAGVGEHDRRTALEDAVDDRLFDVRPHGSGHLGALGPLGEPLAVGRLVGRRGARWGWRVEHVVDRHHDRQVERLGRPRRDDVDRLRTAEESGDLVDRAHGGGEPDALGGGVEQRVEPLEAHREVRAALCRGDRVHLVDDDGVDAAQGLGGLARQHEVQRLGSRDEDVGRIGHELATIARRGVARPHPDRDRGDLDAQSPRGLADAHERRSQVALHVDAEGLQRRDVEDAGARGRLLRAAARGSGIRDLGRLLAEHPVDREQERRERLARSGGRDHEGIATGGHGLPRALLGGGGRRERTAEPVLRRRTESVEHVGHADILSRTSDIAGGLTFAGRGTPGSAQVTGRARSAARPPAPAAGRARGARGTHRRG